MPLIANVGTTDTNVRFFCSATLELVSSLHVISDPSHHITCMDWYEQTLPCLDHRLLERIRAFGGKYTKWAFVMDIVDIIVDEEVDGTCIPDDFEEIRTGIETMDEGLFIYIFLGETLVSDERDISRLKLSKEEIEKIDLRDVYPFISKENVDEFLSDPACVKQELLEIMQDYHDAVFRMHWEKFQSLYATTVLRERKYFGTKLPMEYILSLHKDLVLENESLTMRKEARLSLAIESIREVRLFFSMFTFPHLMATVIGETISIYENMIFPQVSADHETLAERIRALSEVNRLAILRLLSSNPASNKELAQILEITPASVSQHIKLLRSMDMITCSREKNNIYYNINPDAILDIFSNIDKFLSLHKAPRND